MKISVVSPYFNRKNELYLTLKAMTKSVVKDFEYIVVDDGSSPNQRIEDLKKEFSFLDVIRIDPQNKLHVNPCIPFNMGIAHAKGEIVILQSPECMYMGDVLEYVLTHTKDNQYLVFSCFSLSPQSSNNLKTVNFDLPIGELKSAALKAIGGLTTHSAEGPAGRNNSWFAHPTYRECIYNFLVSMTKEDLYDLGGFDERFANGHGYDDTDFAARVKKKGMGIVMVEDPFCLHQHHRSVLVEFPDFRAKEALNRGIYEAALKSPNYKVKNSFLEGTSL